LIRSNQTQGPIFGFDLKMLGRFDHRPFEPKSNPFLGSIQRCWAGLTMIKAKSNQAQIRFFAYRSVRSYQTKPNRTHFGFGLTFLMFGLTSVKPNLIKLTLSSILLNNPFFFLSFSNVHFIHVDIMNYTDTFSLYNIATMHKVITRCYT
jgi:hypothetical protein